MKRVTILFIAVAAGLPAAARAASVALGPATQAAIDAHAARGAKLEIRRTALGGILATGRGFTVYMFTRDARNRDTCVAISGCTSIWPLVTSTVTPRLGAGVRRSLVGTIKLPGGAHQLTYAGHPLYTYIGDSGPGDTAYVGAHQFGGRWFALNSAGHAVK